MSTSADTPEPTFGEAWHTWLAYRSCSSRPIRLSTLADYESSWRCHLAPRLGDTRLSEIDGATIARLVVDLSATGMKPKRLHNIMVPVRACLRWHHRMSSFDRDPTPWFDAPAPQADERRILTIEQIEQLIETTPAFYRPLVTFAAYTGMRLGELRALTWGDIDLVARTVRVNKTLFRNQLQRSTKSGHDRTVPIPLHVAETLREWRSRCPSHADTAPLFPGEDGKALDGDAFRVQVFKRAARDAGLPPDLRIHDLRHTSASLYLQNGATVREVMEIHGWRQMQTALNYLHTGDTLGAAADRLSSARESRLRDGR